MLFALSCCKTVWHGFSVTQSIKSIHHIFFVFISLKVLCLYLFACESYSRKHEKFANIVSHASEIITEKTTLMENVLPAQLALFVYLSNPLQKQFQSVTILSFPSWGNDCRISYSLNYLNQPLGHQTERWIDKVFFSYPYLSELGHPNLPNICCWTDFTECLNTWQMCLLCEEVIICLCTAIGEDTFANFDCLGCDIKSMPPHRPDLPYARTLAISHCGRPRFILHEQGVMKLGWDPIWLIYANAEYSLLRREYAFLFLRCLKAFNVIRIASISLLFAYWNDIRLFLSPKAMWPSQTAPQRK